MNPLTPSGSEAGQVRDARALDEPAFPRNYDRDGHNGMWLRDYFAAKAMQAEMITTFSDATPEAADDFAAAAQEAGRSPEDHLAFNAYLIADAMLRARAA